MYFVNKYAVIKIAGKQYIVREGDKLKLTRQKEPLEIGVLLYSNEGAVLVGTPELDQVSVKASIFEDKRGRKIRVARYKSKSRYRKEAGHRQPLSIVSIEKIDIRDKKHISEKEKTKEEDVKETKPRNQADSKKIKTKKITEKKDEKEIKSPAKKRGRPKKS